ncbi:hypothetical protein E0493_05020 [Roseomonas sp. M0104]|uniref:Cell division protein FtsL n=1 Tax=Teichococcus coralli TaxID=2545983 RepID=A0A845B4Z8_9PROT|nr:hypothetical protein [Pseudoroseomonas coralli]MXP62713.1 hypothetical protein [Pseudoroseomonas coralli]
MFRPLTVVAITAFSLVGWHVYRAEEAATQLDRELRDVTRRIEAARERTQVLKAEWAMLNEPERLRQMAQKHLPLDTMTPSQFLRLTDLERRLPAPLTFAGPVDLFGPAQETALAAAEPAASEPSVAPMKTAAAAVPAPAAHAAPPFVAKHLAAAEPAPRPTPRPLAEPAPRRAEPVAVVARRIEPVAPHRPLPAPREAIPVSAPARLGIAEVRPVARPEPSLLRASAQLPMGRAMAAPAPVGSALGSFAGGGSLPPPVPMAAPVPVAPGTWSR